MLRKLALILLLEIAVGANAGISFRLLDRYTAGLWAGACFVALGLFILTYFFKWDFKSRTPLFWVAFIHTFGFAIPILAQRLMVPADESVTRVLWLPMDYFHKTSTRVYGALIAATLFEVVREILRMRRKNPKI